MEPELQTRLSKITSQHSGGLVDIVKTLEESTRQIAYTVNEYQDTTDLEGKPHRSTVKIDHQISGQEVAAEIQKELQSVPNGAMTGVAAGAVYRILAKYQLPEPGHKDWDKPAALWF